MQAATQYVLRSGNTSTSMDQTCNRYLSLWGSILPTNFVLQKQVSCCAQDIIQDRTTCCNSMWADIFWLWLARYFGFWQWTMLHSRNFYKYDEWVWCQSHFKLPHYLESNGLAEKFVKIVKNLFYKAKEEGKDPFKSLMIYYILPCQAVYNLWCKSYKAGLQHQISPCQLVLENNLV